MTVYPGLVRGPGRARKSAVAAERAVAVVADVHFVEPGKRVA
ncbi:hypothetical protein [Mycobacterium ostraviense]|nr:hypothetical protein [Mycobacterium ostraviense]